MKINRLLDFKDAGEKKVYEDSRTKLSIDIKSDSEKIVLDDIELDFEKIIWDDMELDFEKIIWDDIDPESLKKLWNIDSVDLGIPIFDDVAVDISSSSENKINIRREEILRKDFTNTLITCILDEDFEFGHTSRSEEIIKKQFSVNALATRNWLNEIFIKNFHDEKILIGILRIIGRFEEDLIFPQGQTMALATFVHENDEIKELGIRAFENWNSINSLDVLTKVDIKSKWLQEYLNQVIKELTEELCLS